MDAMVQAAMARVSVGTARIAGRDGVVVRDVQEFLTGRTGTVTRSLTLATFLHCDAGGHPRFASAMAGPEGNVDAALGEVVAASPAPGPDEMGYFIAGRANGRTPGLGPGGPAYVDREVCARVLAAVHDAIARSGLPSHVRDAFSILRAMPAGLARLAAGPLLRPDHDGARALAAANPVAFLLAISVPDAGGLHGDPSPWAGHGFTPALARRMAGIPLSMLPDDVTRDRLGAMALLARTVPVDWFPAGDGARDVRAFHDAAEACQRACGAGLDRGTLCASSGGDWVAFNARCLSGLRHHRGWSGGDDVPAHADVVRMIDWTLADVPTSLAASVLLPLAIRAGESPGRDDPLREMLPVATGLVYGDKSLPACIEVSGRWHRHRHVIDGALPSDHDDKAWDPLHPPMTVDGFEIVPLTSSVDLVAEGSPEPDANGVPGLDHCVGGVTYRANGHSRVSHFVSVRSRGETGPYERVATAQMSFRGDLLRIDQVQGRGNSRPGDAVLRALDRYAALPVRPVPVLPLRDDPDALRQRVGYDPTDDALVERALRAWEPYLPRDMRGLTLDEFDAAVRPGKRDPAP